MNEVAEQAPGAPADTDANGQEPDTPDAQDTNSTTPDAKPAKGTDGQAPKEAKDVASLPDWAQKEIKSARTQAANARTEKQAAAKTAQEAEAQRDAVLKALGLKTDGSEEPPDPKQLAEQAASFQGKAWEMGVENGVLRLASKLEVDADELLDSNKFLNSLEELVDEDPNAGDFRDKLADHIKAFVKDNPKFKAQAAKATPGKSGTAMPGAPTPPAAKERPKSLFAAVDSAYKSRR